VCASAQSRPVCGVGQSCVSDSPVCAPPTGVAYVLPEPHRCVRPPVRPSARPSVRPSARPPVRPSVPSVWVTPLAGWPPVHSSTGVDTTGHIWTQPDTSGHLWADPPVRMQPPKFKTGRYTPEVHPSWRCHFVASGRVCAILRRTRPRYTPAQDDGGETLWMDVPLCAVRVTWWSVVPVRRECRRARRVGCACASGL
jgi:hypothetical protein